MRTNMGSPRVTVLMAVYNSERFLRQAVESILRQTFTDFEFLIVNDGSTDQSRDILLTYDDPRIRLIDNPENIGLTKSLNRGLALARGDLVARLDADDVSHPTRLEKQVRFMDANPDIALVGTQARTIDADGNMLRRVAEYQMQSQLALEWSLLFGNPFVHSSVMFRRQIVWERLGGYDERYRFNQDFELWSRLLARYRASNIAEALIDYRSHAESIVGMRGEQVLESRRHNLLMNLAVQRKNVLRVLGSETLADRWPDIWTAIKVSWLVDDTGSSNEVLDYIHRILEAFTQRYASAHENPELRRHLAETLCYVACHLAARKRLTALKSYAWAIRAHPRVALGGFARFAILFVAGESGLHVTKRFRKALQRAYGQLLRRANA